MKRLLYVIVGLISMIQMTEASSNPFFGKYKTPFETPPFDKIKTAHYEPAFDEGIRLLNKEIEQIANNPQPATFENTIVALERSGELLDKVSYAFFNVLNAESNDEMMEISQRVSPKLSESSNNIYLNDKLFIRVQTIYNQKEQLNLSTEDAKLLNETFEAFKKQGATLNKEDKDKYRQLSTELSLLTLQFDQNALKDKIRFEMLITEEEELSGLPESVREAAATLAKSKGKTGWLFNLSAPSYSPFMRYSDLRPLREKLYRAYMSVGNKGDEFDNREIIKKIVNIRLEIARLMGNSNFAEYKLEHTMAKTPAAVYNLLNELLDAYKPTAINEYNAVQGFAMGMSKENITVMPWDWSYYSEKLKDIRFQVNDEMTRPYFELNQVKKGVFGLATQLYGITFKENKKIPVYHPEVEAYEVYDEEGRFLSILYTDFHPRDGKQSGAWMNSMKAQYHDSKGKNSRPQVIIVMNFTRATETKPSLLSFDEVNTFLHEFGHALHGMLANGKYASLSGTSVYRDFVELPSQIMENWLTEKEYLDQIAVHYETGEKIPQELVQNLVDASNFNVGYTCCRQLSFGMLDMAWHTLTTPFEGDVTAFEKQAWAPTNILPEVESALMSSSFGHIFSGGYAAGYYGYKWAEVLDSDAFSLFKTHGIFDKKTARSFREHILSKGGTEDPAVLYKRFRGQEPTIEALLIKNGIK
ncbi:peptidyl-dipeptidase Dcp [Parabacteroides sp. PM5-20]|uniref:M3 family metallopeptidase n=1 Tax=unclassified Parabacteroides TaxID=2649774 RepID=UPI001940BC02|nr:MULTISPECIES: M3 family metallopeptidase [unclassified Parabacteroides]MDH6534523.1 peptidyl-dipeptidase Dcp [Parabacteroides sp. PM5-20]